MIHCSPAEPRSRAGYFNISKEIKEQNKSSNWHNNRSIFVEINNHFIVSNIVAWACGTYGSITEQ